MGKGDKKSRKGKRFRGSFGKTRPKKEKKIKAKEKKEARG
jgi:30S ribosomal protein S31